MDVVVAGWNPRVFICDVCAIPKWSRETLTPKQPKGIEYNSKDIREGQWLSW